MFCFVERWLAVYRRHCHEKNFYEPPFRSLRKIPKISRFPVLDRTEKLIRIVFISQPEQQRKETLFSLFASSSYCVYHLSWKFALSRFIRKGIRLMISKFISLSLARLPHKFPFSHWNNYPASLSLSRCCVFVFAKLQSLWDISRWFREKKTLNYISEYLEHIAFFQFFSIKNNKVKNMNHSCCSLHRATHYLLQKTAFLFSWWHLTVA